MPGNRACAVESGWLLREKLKKRASNNKIVMAKLSFWELIEYDTKGLEGIQSSDYLIGGWN